MSGNGSVLNALRDCRQAISSAGLLQKDNRPSALVDFKAQQREGLRKAVFASIQRLRRSILESECDSKVRGHLFQAVERLEQSPTIDNLELVSELLPDDLPSTRELIIGSGVLVKLPLEIKGEMQADAQELEKCMLHQCYRSAVILCGRILETALHRKYFEATGNDLLEKAPGIGLGNIIAKLQEHGAHLDPALANQVHLINQVRIWSVHKKQDAFNPSKAQAQAIVLYTIDVVEKLFEK